MFETHRPAESETECVYHGHGRERPGAGARGGSGDSEGPMEGPAAWNSYCAEGLGGYRGRTNHGGKRGLQRTRAHAGCRTCPTAESGGIVGLKPTYGCVSTRGVIPLSWSQDHMGPMTRTVHDAALMLQPLAGYDPEDVTSANVPVPDFAAALGKKTSFRLGIPRAYFWQELHPEVQEAMTAALGVLGKLTVSQQ